MAKGNWKYLTLHEEKACVDITAPSRSFSGYRHLSLLPSASLLWEIVFLLHILRQEGARTVIRRWEAPFGKEKKPTKTKGSFKYHRKIMPHCQSLGCFFSEKDWKDLSLQDTTPLSFPAQIITANIDRACIYSVQVLVLSMALQAIFHLLITVILQKKIWVISSLYKCGNKKRKRCFFQVTHLVSRDWVKT